MPNNIGEVIVTVNNELFIICKAFIKLNRWCDYFTFHIYRKGEDDKYSTNLGNFHIIHKGNKLVGCGEFDISEQEKELMIRVLESHSYSNGLKWDLIKI